MAPDGQTPHLPNMPETEAGGFIPTLNQYGYMLDRLDPITEQFVQAAATCKLPVADIGAAYGVTTLPALAAGATVIACDLDPNHLAILTSKAPLEARDRLSVQCGAFPDGYHFEPNSLGACLIARVMHFLTPEAFERGFQNVFRWLAPGGLFFMTAESPYLGTLKAFTPLFEARLASGDPWPGFVPDLSFYRNKRSSHLPDQFLFLDTGTLRRVTETTGFEIQHLDYLARPDFPEDLRHDGRESIALIAQKPAQAS